MKYDSREFHERYPAVQVPSWYWILIAGVLGLVLGLYVGMSL